MMCVSIAEGAHPADPGDVRLGGDVRRDQERAGRHRRVVRDLMAAPLAHRAHRCRRGRPFRGR